MHKLRVGVFMGSQSIEREVSFNSGRTVCDHLDTELYNIIPIFQNLSGDLYILPWRFLYRGKIKDFEHRLEKEAQKICWDDLPSLIDFMYIASHGQYVEDGILQGTLELLNIPYLGSKVLASAICMDKIIQKDILKSNGILTPKSFNLSLQQIENLNLNQIISNLNKKNINLPVVVKPQKSGSSLGIEIVKEKNNLIAAIKKANNIEPNRPQAVLIEEYITGLEFTCIVIEQNQNNTKENIALPPTEIVPENNSNFFDYRQKYMPGCATKFTPARCTKENLKLIQNVCIKVKEILEIENIARIDGFLTKDNKIIITDPNTLAGMAPSSFIFRQAAEINMNHTDFINYLIKTELENYNIINKNNKTLKNKENNQKLKVAVILGGPSNEKEISLESGRNIIYKLSPEKYSAIPLFLDNNLKLYKIDNRLLVRNSTKEIIQDLKPEMAIKWSDLPKLADFVFIGLHGIPGENGIIQGMLEMLKVPYNGSSILTSALCIDKYKTNNYLKSKAFNTPKNKLVTKKDWDNNKNLILTEIETNIKFPNIIKPHDDGCSFFVKKAFNQKDLEQYITEILNSKNQILIEEFISGTELTVGVVGNKKAWALPPSQTVVSKDILSIEEKFLPGAGENQTPAQLPKSAINLIKDTIEKCYKTLNCKGYARIDCFYQNEIQSKTNKEKVIILEVNTLPGMTPATCIFHQAAEVNLTPMEFIDLIIKLGLEEHKKQADTTIELLSHKNLNIKEKTKL